MKIGVVGGGVVGRATAKVWNEWAEVRINDLTDERSTHSLLSVLDSELIFVCIPEANILEWLSSVPPDDRIRDFVIRSSTGIGTTLHAQRSLGFENIVHHPEFLTERCALADALNPGQLIIGWPGFVPLEENTNKNQLGDLLQQRFSHVPVLQMTSCESEAVKLMQNSVFAVKVALFNELNQLCEKMGLDWEAVRAGVLSGGKTTADHTRVPGPDGKYGFGGKCLPKDLQRLVERAAYEGLLANVCVAAMTRNEQDRKRES